MPPPEEQPPQEPWKSSAEFLIAEYNRFATAFQANEESGERRVSLFLAIATVALGAIGLAGDRDVVDERTLRAGAALILAALTLVGWATLLRLTKRDVVSDQYKTAMDSIRAVFRRADPLMLAGYNPFLRGKEGEEDLGGSRKLWGLPVGLVLLMSSINAALPAGVVIAVAGLISDGLELWDGGTFLLALLTYAGVFVGQVLAADQAERRLKRDVHAYKIGAPNLAKTYLRYGGIQEAQAVDDVEVEDKLIIESERPDEVKAQLLKVTRLDGFRARNRLRHLIRDVYFDTDGNQLSESGMALRVRVQDDQQLVTLKGPTERGKHGSARFEIERPWSQEALGHVLKRLREVGLLPGTPSIHPPAGQSAEEGLKAAGLKARAPRTTTRETVEIHERGWRFILPFIRFDRRLLAELAVDEVHFELPDRKVRHFEVEVEAKGKGDAKAVGRILLAFEAKSKKKKFSGELCRFPYSKLAIGKALERLWDRKELDALLEGDTLRPDAYGRLERVLTDP